MIRLSRGIMGAVFATLLVVTGTARAETPIKIGLSVTDATFLSIYIAQDRGFFKKEGLDVTFVQFDSDTSAAMAVTAGAVEMIGSSPFPVLDAYAAGRDLVAFWTLQNQPVYIWYAPAKFQSIKDIKGGRIGVSSIGSVSQQISAWAVGRSGLDPVKDVTYLPLGGPLNRMAALQSGQVDLIPTTAPGTFILQKQGYKPLLDLSTLMPEFCELVFYTKRANLDKNAEQFRAVIRAAIHAKHWGVAHPEEATKVLMERLGAPADQKDVFAKTAVEALPYVPEDGHFPVESLNVFLQFYKDQGKIKEIPPLSAYTDDRFITHFKQEPIKD